MTTLMGHRGMGLDFWVGGGALNTAPLPWACLVPFSSLSLIRCSLLITIYLWWKSVPKYSSNLSENQKNHPFESLPFFWSASQQMHDLFSPDLSPFQKEWPHTPHQIAMILSLGAHPLSRSQALKWIGPMGCYNTVSLQRVVKSLPIMFCRTTPSNKSIMN